MKVLFCLFFPCLALGQGQLVVSPISKFQSISPHQISFFVQNLSSEDLSVSVQDICDVDGKVFDGRDCNNFVEVTTTAEKQTQNGGLVYLIEANQKITFSAKLKPTVQRYVLYKPLLDPVSTKTSAEKKAGLEFGYQPGFLFVKESVEPKNKLKVDQFVKETRDGATFVKFNIKLESLEIPAVYNISAKISKKDDAKTIRFVSLAKEKILDPKRGMLTLEAEIGLKVEASSLLCFELFLQNQVTLNNEKISGCEPTRPKPAIILK